MTTAPRHTLLYGLRIDSELPLHQVRWVPGDRLADVTIRVGEQMDITDGRPPGRVLLDPELGGRSYCATVRGDGSYILRCRRACDFVIEPNLRDVTVRIVSGADPALASVLTTGTLLSFLLMLRGHLVLHASAVQVGDVAVAFVGSTGMGKSTMAALMSARGAALVSDDVLRVDLCGDAESRPMCHVGTTEVRLRRSGGHVASLFDTPLGTRRTVDDRDALRLAGAITPRLPLAAIVIPRPAHDGDRQTPHVERLDPKVALLTLLRFPRILGWRDPAAIHRHFHQLGDAVGRVPVHVARVPWGPPFADGITESLLDAVGVDRPMPAIHR